MRGEGPLLSRRHVGIVDAVTATVDVRAPSRVRRAEQVLLTMLGLLVLRYSVAVLSPVHLVPPLDPNVWGFTAISVVAATAIAMRGDRTDPTRRGWRFVALGVLVLGAANLVYAWPANPSADNELDAAADFIAVLGMLPVVHGLGSLVWAWTPIRDRTELPDAILVGLSVFAVATSLLSHGLDGASRGSLASMAVNDLGVLVDIVVVALIVAALQAADWPRRGPLPWLLGAGLAMAGTDGAYLVAIAHGSYVPGGAIDVGWPVTGLLLTIASQSQAAPTGSTWPIAQRAPLVMPTVLVAAVAAVLVIPDVGPMRWLARTAAVLAVAFAALRMHIAVRQALGLATELREARLDPRTGLPNRRALLALQERELRGSTLVILAIDGVEDVTARHGVATGEAVVTAIVARLRMDLRGADTVLRLGEDEFALVLRDVPAQAVAHLAEALVERIEQPLEIAGHSLSVSACAGIAEPAGNHPSPERLLAEASMALRAAQASGGGIVRAFTGQVGPTSEERLRMRRAIRGAFHADAEAFVPYYQPIVDLTDGSILALEALVRWHVDGHVLAPAAFLQEIARADAMPALTMHMLTRSLRELRGAGLDLPVTVNVPPDLVDASLATMVQGAVRTSGSQPRHLIVEVTEDAIIADPQRGASVLAGLRSDGVRVLLDDFGTGWSGLSLLRDFPLDGIKLDASFAAPMWADPTTTTIVRGIAGVAAELGLLVIHEGIETDEHVAAFRAHGVRYVQGFACGRPMPIADLVRWCSLHAESNGTAP